MNIVHVTSWLSRQGGGIPPVIWALARETRTRGATVSVLGLQDQWTHDDCREHGLPFAAEKMIGPKAFGFSPALKNRLQAETASPAILHSHGLWMYPGLAARKAIGKTNRLLVSPHGMLEPWALNNSRWKKKLAAAFFENENLRQAHCLHALCVPEAENFRRCGLKNPIAIIPNGVHFEEFARPRSDAAAEKFPQIKNRRRLLFLSRLHPKKGLVNLLPAWRKISPDFKEWQLLIAGAGSPAFESELKASSEDLISQNSVVFLGQVYGEDKRQLLSAADAFVLPSFSEGFSVAILEAAAASLPVLLTPECNFPELAAAGAALEISTDIAGIEKGLRQILETPDVQRQAMGRRGRELIRQRYTWPVIAAQMCRVYDWLFGLGPIPETIKTV